MSQSQPKSRAARFLRAGVAGLAMLATGATVSTGCLDRPVAPATPKTSNIFVDVITQTAIDKIDLLFVIDNSISMADKQVILGEAVPQLVNRLVTPVLIDGVPEFKAVNDIHIGVVTSSLGGHGADFCSPTGSNWNPTQDDHGHLVGTLQASGGPLAPTRSSAPAGYSGFGFLAWDPAPKYNPPGEANAANLINDFRAMVTAAGETGCGFEATLEGWYRFLIDPTPPLNVVVQNGNAVPEGQDDALLAQRANFLRPDSLVAIIMLTDENDCSVVDGGIGWLSSQGFQGGGVFHLPRATSFCADPNNPCCTSCGSTSPPANCPSLPTVEAIRADSECVQGAHAEATDALNLRCWEQKRRFGVDFLYPTDRYVNALKSRTVRNRENVDVQNPLYGTAGGTAPRDTGLVFLAGIIGVPWQDIATPETRTDPTRLEYLPSDEITWDWIVGDVNTYVKAADPLMHEQPEPRSGVNPAINVPIAPATSQNPQENPINGHEYNIPDRNDLQYACIFELTTPRPCTTPNCDCGQADIALNKPLCQPPGGGAPTETQYFAKGYPGLRLLQVLKDFGANSIVASICPKITTGDVTSANYGYNPAVGAIIARLKEALSTKCLPRKLIPDPLNENKVPCEVIEALAPGNALPCDPARGTSDLLVPGVDEGLDAAVRAKLAELGSCAGQTGLDCASFSLCRINQLTGGDLANCQAGTATTPGYCYVDETINLDLVSTCPDETQRQLLNFVAPVGVDVPAKNSIGFIACSGKTFESTEVTPIP